jgi:glycosyltransferase involved in cell wall biosynthesis
MGAPARRLRAADGLVKLSAVVIAGNEAHRIARCLNALRFCDEVLVVVDANATDGTADAAKPHADRVLVRAFDDFSSQRNWAEAQAAGDWILVVDCDEQVTPELAAEVRSAAQRADADAYRIVRLDYMFGKWIRHGGWYPQYHVRLFKRGATRWVGDVHERIEVNGTLGTLRAPILHFSHARVEDWVNKMARYTTIEARSLHAAGRRAGVWQILCEPPLYFGYKYVVQQGWRDGWHGLVLALLLGGYRMIVYLKLWDLRQSERGPGEREDCPPSTSRS